MEIDGMARDAAAWLTRRALYARTVTIKVRYQDFVTVTRSHSAVPTRDEDQIAARAVALLDRTEAGARPVRLLGVSVHNLSETDAPETPGRRGRSPDRPDREPRLPFDHA
jgi:DNA polymerase-4